ncbi:hypothetical protein A3SI_15708 [Nitritalea halalkaliphila LW7]|uniref:Uncharacterized protein n=1 Tax=Nitritalea halalkaliphila LW7 TaxID=1189621 RepID=I5BYC0_9BACT|nr:hypothetical protein A3SI_15708 [Nitritalea halalkaliphila LW7]
MSEAVKVLQEHVHDIIDTDYFSSLPLNANFISAGHHLTLGKSSCYLPNVLISSAQKIDKGDIF